MQTSFRLFALGLTLSALLFACTPGLDKLLTRQEGTWNIDAYNALELLGGDTLLAFELTDAGTMTFDDDGSGTQIIDILGLADTTQFTWTYDAGQEQITVRDDSSTTTFDVLGSEKDNQFFQWEETSRIVDPFSGDTVESVSRLELMLSRIEG